MSYPGGEPGGSLMLLEKSDCIVSNGSAVASSELETVRKETISTELRHYFKICLEGQERTSKNFGYGILS